MINEYDQSSNHNAWIKLLSATKSIKKKVRSRVTPKFFFLEGETQRAERPRSKL